MRKRYLLAFLAVACACVIVASASYADFGPAQTKRERERREARDSGVVRESKASINAAYEKIHECFLTENYSEVDRLSREYLAAGRNQPNTEDVLNLQALSLLKLNRVEEARQKLRELENSFIPLDRKASASASIGDSYFYEGNYLRAREGYEETLRKYPYSDQAAYLKSQLNEISMKSGKLKGIAEKGTSSFNQKNGQAPFTVQVGSFSKQKNAKALVNKLIFRNYDAYVEKDETSRMYRVRVGRLSSKEEAVVLEAKLKKEGYPTKIFP